ncbi:hypothetical protein OOK60_01540 [Trichothermofontia sichuanensis B231]|uniref:hypothetical protein n=1 Tax=Trichothermofontia sichuanensis TaxID=3045816 RepID=UPI002247FD1A|nr:hypothetical protein [Trichothermofontia sichuanensis]UZQ54792.1 hypothetical protein OOK60_01540 [Trichothermofontia sichuanensis B231]
MAEGIAHEVVGVELSIVIDCDWVNCDRGVTEVAMTGYRLGCHIALVTFHYGITSMPISQQAIGVAGPLSCLPRDRLSA